MVTRPGHPAGPKALDAAPLVKQAHDTGPFACATGAAPDCTVIAAVGATGERPLPRLQADAHSARAVINSEDLRVPPPRDLERRGHREECGEHPSTQQGPRHRRGPRRPPGATIRDDAAACEPRARVSEPRQPGVSAGSGAITKERGGSEARSGKREMRSEEREAGIGKQKREPEPERAAGTGRRSRRRQPEPGAGAESGERPSVEIVGIEVDVRSAQAAHLLGPDRRDAVLDLQHRRRSGTAPRRPPGGRGQKGPAADDVGDAGLVLESQEHESFRGARTLARDHHAGDAHAAARRAVCRSDARTTPRIASSSRRSAIGWRPV